MGNLLNQIRSTLSGQVSVSLDVDGRISVTDNQIGNSDLTVTLIEENEGGGSLNFGSIEAQIEGRYALDVTAYAADGKLQLEHNGFGSRNGFEIKEDIAELGLTSGTFEGEDVAGTINGEAANGLGQILTGALDSENISGLSLRINQDSADIGSGGEDMGNVDLIFGVARRLSDSLNSITDQYEGTLINRERAIEATIDDLDDRIANMERRVERKRLNLVGRFASLEGSIANLQSQGNFLASQLAGLAPG